MKGDKAIIAKLNTILTNELTSVNQYFLHARMYDNWGYLKLGKKTYDESIEEMRHADALIKRILFLEGLPNVQSLLKMNIGEAPQECLTADLQYELKGRDDLIATIEACELAKDFVSRNLLREILDDTEEHIDYLETQLGLIASVGLQNYLQSMMGGDE
jgi:bacterioferritin